MIRHSIFFWPARFQDNDPLGQRGRVEVTTYKYANFPWDEPTVSVESFYTNARNVDELFNKENTYRKESESKETESPS